MTLNAQDPGFRAVTVAVSDVINNLSTHTGSRRLNKKTAECD
jgi:hypothetical protein